MKLQRNCAIFALSILVVCLIVICINYFSDDSVPTVTDAYTFFSSFIPNEELREGKDGHIYWIPECVGEKSLDLMLCNELVFPDKPQSPENYPYSSPPRQNCYEISFLNEQWETLVMRFEIKDQDGNKFLPQDFNDGSGGLTVRPTAGNEMSLLQVYVLKCLDGVWYSMNCLSNYYDWLGGQTEIVPAVMTGIIINQDVDVELYPIPSGRYALALCDERQPWASGQRTYNCYGLLEFDLVCEEREGRYMVWVEETENLRQYWKMPIKYRIENVGETIYYDPAK